MIAVPKLARARALLSRLPGKAIIGAEIGVLDGTMSGELLLRRDVNLIMVDKWDSAAPSREYILTGDPIARMSPQSLAEARRRAMERTAFASPRRLLLVGDSVSSGQVIAPNSLDFAFIDASHSFEEVKNDIKVWFTLVTPGGWLCGHDYRDRYQWTQGVTRAVDEFALERDLEIEIGEDCTWFVRKPQPIL